MLLVVEDVVDEVGAVDLVIGVDAAAAEDLVTVVDVVVAEDLVATVADVVEEAGVEDLTLGQAVSCLSTTKGRSPSKYDFHLYYIYADYAYLSLFPRILALLMTNV